MKSSKIQQKLWALAHHDVFLMQYCPTLYNKIAGIGVFFLFQMLIVFGSVLATYNLSVDVFQIAAWPLAIGSTYLFYKSLKFIAHIPFLVQLVLNLIGAFLLCIPFCLLLFEQEILFLHYTETGTVGFGLVEQLWLKPYGLYKSFFIGKEGYLIAFASLAMFVLITFVFIIPHILIYQNRNSPYHLLKKNYDYNFN